MLRYRRRQHAVAQKKFLRRNVGLLVLWEIVIQRPHERQRFPIKFFRRGVDVRHKDGPQVETAARRLLGIVLPEPGALVDVAGGMEPEDRRNGAELQPSGVDLAVVPSEEAAQVMRPVAAARVGGNRRHTDLELQLLPGAAGVAGKFHGMLLVAQASPTRQRQASSFRPVGVFVIKLV